jgi:FkbM family methyltransferase
MISRWLKVFSTNGSLRVRFSQYGEDVILHKIFKNPVGFYIDVGAHHPFRQSNTAYLWCSGWNGINIDANPKSIEIFNKVRKNDENIWAAIVSDEDAANKSHIDLICSETRDLDLGASVSETIATERSASRRISVPTKSLTQIVNAVQSKTIDYMNIDIEGVDLDAILGMAGWQKLPKVISIETYQKNIREILSSEVNQQLERFGYELKYHIGLTSIYMQSNFESTH